MIGVSTLLGFGAFALLGALGIGVLGRRGRHDVATALALVVMLGLGALFVDLSVEYTPEIYSLLFGEILGVGASQLTPTIALAIVCVTAIIVLYRTLMSPRCSQTSPRHAAYPLSASSSPPPHRRRTRDDGDRAGRRHPAGLRPDDRPPPPPPAL